MTTKSEFVGTLHTLRTHGESTIDCLERLLREGGELAKYAFGHAESIAQQLMAEDKDTREEFTDQENLKYWILSVRELGGRLR